MNIYLPVIYYEWTAHCFTVLRLLLCCALNSETHDLLLSPLWNSFFVIKLNVYEKAINRASLFVHRTQKKEHISNIWMYRRWLMTWHSYFFHFNWLFICKNVFHASKRFFCLLLQRLWPDSKLKWSNHKKQWRILHNIFSPVLLTLSLNLHFSYRYFE